MFRRQLALAITVVATGVITLGPTAAAHAEKIGGASVQNGTSPTKKCDVRGGITLKAGQSIKFNQGTIKVGNQILLTHEVASCNKRGTQYCEKTVVNGKTVSTKCVAAMMKPPQPPREPVRPVTTTASPDAGSTPPVTAAAPDADAAPAEPQTTAPGTRPVSRPADGEPVFAQGG